MKIPFDIKFRPQIESGEYRVETNAGCPVRIVCWNMACELPILGLVLLNNKKTEEIAVGFTNEGSNLLGEPLYDKLFIITPEEELMKFEKSLTDIIEILHLEYEKGRNDALKDLPRWRTCDHLIGTENPFPRYLVRTGGVHYSLTSVILKCDEYIPLSELAKLPVFKE